MRDKVDRIIAELGGNKEASIKLKVYNQSLDYWRKRGIPRDYWRKIMRLTKGRVTLEQLFKTFPES